MRLPACLLIDTPEILLPTSIVMAKYQKELKDLTASIGFPQCKKSISNYEPAYILDVYTQRAVAAVLDYINSGKDDLVFNVQGKMVQNLSVEYYLGKELGTKTCKMSV